MLKQHEIERNGRSRDLLQQVFAAMEDKSKKCVAAYIGRKLDEHWHTIFGNSRRALDRNNVIAELAIWGVKEETFDAGDCPRV